MTDLARLLIITGAVLLAAGVALLLAGKVPWLGRLPGDIAIERDNFRFYFPVATSILLSVLLSLVLWLLRR